MTQKKQHPRDSKQSPDRERDRHDDFDDQLSPDIDFPEPASGSGQTPIGG